jgi:hypothetical protein
MARSGTGPARRRPRGGSPPSMPRGARGGATVLCCAVLCCAVLCCAVLCCAVLCCAARSRRPARAPCDGQAVERDADGAEGGRRRRCAAGGREQQRRGDGRGGEWLLRPDGLGRCGGRAGRQGRAPQAAVWLCARGKTQRWPAAAGAAERGRRAPHASAQAGRGERRAAQCCMPRHTPPAAPGHRPPIASPAELRRS